MTQGFEANPCRPMPWLDAFAVGDPRIDAEHRALMDGCNQFCRLVAAGAATAEIMATVHRLAAAFEDHMASEEALFPAIRFPGGPRHLAEHQRLRARLTELTAHASRAQPARDLGAHANALRAQLVEHLLRYDLAYKTWVEEARG
ncbi:MAG: hemerythrin domain-containing protein [Pseudomonadota bacterium]